MKLIALFLIVSAACFAAPSSEMECTGRVNAFTKIKIEKNGNQLTITKTLNLGVIKKEITFQETIAFRQGLSSKGPYIGYGDKAYGFAKVEESQRKRADLHYGNKFELVVPWTIDDMGEVRKSTFSHDDIKGGKKIALGCTILIFG